MSALEECSEPEYFTVDSIKITPAVGPLNAPIHVDLALNTKHDIKDAHWEIKWVLDSIRRRYVIVLGKTEPTNYSAGKVTLNFESGAVDVSHYKTSQLNNVGLLVASLYGRIPGVTPDASAVKDASVEPAEIGSVQLVVQAMPQEDGLVRCILNPWDA